jgi:serine/threonine protein kinase
MTPTTYAQLCDEVYARILGRLKRREEETLRFAVKGTAKKVLNNSILERFFRSLDLPELSAESHSHVSETELIARLGDRNLYDFLAIMIFATCTINAARTFTTKLLIHESWPRDRFSLPVGREQLEELFGEDIITPDKFLAHQACFCPITIVKGHEVVGTEQERLPYLEEELKASGSFGRVYKVKIAEGHFLIDPLTGATNKEPVTIARKDYLRAEDDSGGEEPGSDDQIMKQIVSAERTCRNIVEFFGSVAIGSTTYSLFMPLAICDLKDFMMKKFSTEPDGITEKAALIYSAHGLAGGLDYLHEGMMSGNDKLVCYHMDLKPSNILIYLDGARSEPRYIWKISDFGMSRLKVKRQDVGVESDNNFNSWILSRRKPQEPSASGTENRRGEGTYLAPETIAATPIINEKADVWSLGCVISVLFAYLEEGGLGVDLFADKRVNLRSADGYDRFFIRNWGWVLPFKAHPEVRAWHDRLIHQAKRRNRKEGQAIEFILKYLENEVFKEQSKRCDAKKLKVKLHETYEMYALAEGSSDRPSDIEHLARGESSSMRQWKLRWPSRTSIDYVPESKVSRRFLDYRDGLKGCAFAHDGSLTAFWTDRIISLYTSQNLRGNDARISTLVSEFSLQDTSKGYWKSVSLTERYLIATTSGEEPQVKRTRIGHSMK